MRAIKHFSSFIFVLSVFGLNISLADFGRANDLFQNETIGKSYAVFVVNYNTDNNFVTGGVAGTAFFLNPSRAITAFHVLQKKSFQKQNGFNRKRIWLVHENLPAIELKGEFLKEAPDSDLTEIQFSSPVVSPDVIFASFDQSTTLLLSGNAIQTEGFIANSSGPILVRSNNEIIIQSVPHLQRIFSNGSILGQRRISLISLDVNLKNQPCFNVSYQPIVGLSGGPVLFKGKVIGINSFGDLKTGPTWVVKL